MMKEDLLHYVWRLHLLNLNDLKTTDGRIISVHQFGHLNHDAGPDFLNAIITIDGTKWAGNVEMHLKSSDWIKHRHDQDASYNNVVLHVVYEEDVIIRRNSGEKIPCLELKRRIPHKMKTQYLRLLHHEKNIPCGELLHQVKQFTWRIWLEKLAIERIEEKMYPIQSAMLRTQNNREEVFYQSIARNFGVKVNAEPFECLARSLPLKILSKHKGNLFQLEALLFGQAGMLNQDFKDDYPRQLQKEYKFLRAKYQLKPISVSSWKNLRLRPANFPSIRIAQFAGLIHQSQRLFSRVLCVENYQDIVCLFDVSISDYWKSHYVFDKKSIKKNKKIGASTIKLITINTIVPSIFYYGKDHQNEQYIEKALLLLDGLKPEKNKIISMWKQLGIDADNASQSQALIQLKKKYCNARKCLNCMVGNEVLKTALKEI